MHERFFVWLCSFFLQYKCAVQYWEIALDHTYRLSIKEKTKHASSLFLVPQVHVSHSIIFHQYLTFL